eukprot:986535-Prymnesium_polylepis.1
MSASVVLPPGGLVSFSVYDFDGGPDGGCREQVKMLTTAEYTVPKLRPSSGNDVARKTLGDNPFNSPDDGLAAADPSDPTNLTDDQASRAVQFFFRPANGYIDAQLGATTLGIGGTCESGGEFLFAGDSDLCAPPPPLPPSPPPLPPPPSPPPSPPP